MLQYYTGIFKGILLPQSTGHIRMAYLPCALACERQDNWHTEISVQIK